MQCGVDIPEYAEVIGIQGVWVSPLSTLSHEFLAMSDETYKDAMTVRVSLVAQICIHATLQDKHGVVRTGYVRDVLYIPIVFTTSLADLQIHQHSSL